MKVVNHKLCGCINNRTWGFSITEVQFEIHFKLLNLFHKE